LHAKPQLVPSHVALALVGGVQAMHDAPHEPTLVFATHAPAHKWKPVLHTNPHVVPSHVAIALAGVAHGVHDDPHALTSLLLRHAPEHMW
jgi:hypothetical protein